MEEINAELPVAEDGTRFSARANHTFVEVDAPEIPDVAARRWQVGICNGGTSGSKLSRQLAELVAAAQGARPGRVPVAVRASPYPGKSPTSQIAKQCAAMIKEGGRRVVIEDAE